MTTIFVFCLGAVFFCILVHIFEQNLTARVRSPELQWSSGKSWDAIAIYELGSTWIPPPLI